MNETTEIRQVIGESEGRGLPISGVLAKEIPQGMKLRWVILPDGTSYTLEAINEKGEWQEVPILA